MLITVLFVTLLTAPLASAFVAPSTEELENRRLAPLPGISSESVVNLSFFQGMAAYVSDRMSVRTLGIRTAAFIHYRLLGESPNPQQVLLGEDGWLFSRDTFEDSCDDATPAFRIAGLLEVVDRLEAMGKTVIYTVAPDKMSIYPDRLTPDGEALAACSIDAGRANESALDSSARDGYVDLWSILRSAADRNDVYFRTDSHFNHFGNRLFFERIVQLAAPATELTWVETQGEHYGNLMRTMGLRPTESVIQVQLVHHSDPIRTNVSDTRFAPDAWATEVWQTAEPLVDRSVLVLKDSFFDLGMQDFASLWSKTTFTDLRSASSVETFVEEALRHDIIVIETAEHALPTRFNAGGAIASIVVEDQ